MRFLCTSLGRYSGDKCEVDQIRPQCIIQFQFPLIYLSKVLKPKNQEKIQPPWLDCASVVRDGICNGGLFYKIVTSAEIMEAVLRQLGLPQKGMVNACMGKECLENALQRQLDLISHKC